MALTIGTYTAPETSADSEALETAWVASTAFVMGQYIQPSNSHFVFGCTTAGTSAVTAPTWPVGQTAAVTGLTVTDGTVVWTCLGKPQAFFQDVAISAASLGDGTLRQRFDLKAFPQKGIKYTGTDGDGNTVPKPAKTVVGLT